ncbi:MAG: hypothetical protein M1827_003625 [Pycnora praestabilis]|nr:MAG: hypothetical protein M1827_003625 [Pycnora praestabilis]
MYNITHCPDLRSRAQHHQRPGNTNLQRTTTFPNGSTITFGPYDPRPLFTNNSPFINQVDEIDRIRRDVELSIQRHRGLVPGDEDTDEPFSEGGLSSARHQSEFTSPIEERVQDDAVWEASLSQHIEDIVSSSLPPDRLPLLQKATPRIIVPEHSPPPRSYTLHQLLQGSSSDTAALRDQDHLAESDGHTPCTALPTRRSQYTMPSMMNRRTRARQIAHERSSSGMHLMPPHLRLQAPALLPHVAAIHDAGQLKIVTDEWQGNPIGIPRPVFRHGTERESLITRAETGGGDEGEGAVMTKDVEGEGLVLAEPTFDLVNRRMARRFAAWRADRDR